MSAFPEFSLRRQPGGTPLTSTPDEKSATTKRCSAVAEAREKKNAETRKRLMKAQFSFVMVQFSSLELTNHEHRIESPETERVGNCYVYIGFSQFIRDVIEITLGIREFIIDGGVNLAISDG